MKPWARPSRSSARWSYCFRYRHGRRRAQAVGALSEREREVAALIAKGKTNREIAAALSISTKTVENHLASIFAKLEATRRAQVAVIVREAQLSEDGPG